MLCEFKNCINSIYSFFRCYHIFIKAVFFVVITGNIFFPCLCEGNMFFFVEKEIKLIDSHIVLFKGGSENIRGLVSRIFVQSLYFKNLWGKGIVKAQASKGLGMFAGEVDGDKISAKDTKSNTKKCACDGEKSMAYILWHTFLLWLWPVGPICFVVAVIATIIGNLILIHFTQRSG